jgi:hypothetical protein
MIKHNVRLRGSLMHGLQQAVGTLVDRLLIADELHSVQVNLRSWEDDIETVRTVLRPLSELTNVRDKIEVFGLPLPQASPEANLFDHQDTDWRKRKCLLKSGASSSEINYANVIGRK